MAAGEWRSRIRAAQKCCPLSRRYNHFARFPVEGVMAYVPTVPTRPRTGDAVSSGIVAATVLFLVILAVSAFWDPTIRVLHLFEALLYAGVAALCIRRMKIGYALGVASGAFWLWSAWGL